MDFDNVFDRAMAGADAEIIRLMGIPVIFTIGGQVRPAVSGVFDEPGQDVTWGKESAEIRNTAPTLFVFSADVEGLKRHDLVMINGESYRVTDPGWDDPRGRTGSTVTITLSRGEPGNNTPEVVSPSQRQWRS